MLLGVYAIIHLNLNGIVDTWNRDVHVSAYFASDITEQERLDLRTEILALPEVTKVIYISEEDAQKWLTTANSKLGEIKAGSDLLQRLAKDM